MKVGYCRISCTDQTLNLQRDELLKAGCEKIFEDVASGSKSDREGLKECIEFARKGDVIVCWKLDRIGRSLKHLIEVVNELKERGVGFRCIIQERTKAGLQAARARGRFGGRPKAENSKRFEIASTLYADGKSTVRQICETLKISRATFYRDLKSSR